MAEVVPACPLVPPHLERHGDALREWWQHQNSVPRRSRGGDRIPPDSAFELLCSQPPPPLACPLPITKWEAGVPLVQLPGGECLPRGGHLGLFAGAWEEAGAPPDVVSALRGWQSDMWADVQPVVFRNHTSAVEQHREFVTTELSKWLMLDKLGVWNVAERGLPRVVCPMSVVVQASVKKRLICNAGLTSSLEEAMATYLYPLPTFLKEMGEDEEERLLFNIDFKDGYHQVPLASPMFTYLCLQWQGVV